MPETTGCREAGPEPSFLVFDAAGRVVASAGASHGRWRPSSLAVRELALQVLVPGAGPRSAAVSDDGNWEATAMRGSGPGGAPVAIVRVEPRGPGGQETAAGLEAERHEAFRRLVGGLVHELRNPLASISLIAELLGLRPELEPAVKERLADIVHHVERTEEVLQSLRRFSREEPGTLRTVAINDLVHDAVRLERGLAESHGVEVVLDLASDLPRVLADASQMRLAVANLVRNAAEAVTSAGRPGTVRVRSSERHGVVRLVVEDDGPGIAPEVLGRLFQPHVTTKPQGSGLGLPMTLGIVRAHGGYLRAENRRGGGARFVIDLPDPTLATPARQITTLGVELTRGPGRSALVVEADEAQLERLRGAIAGIGWKVHTAQSSEVALRKLRAADFDALLIAPGCPDALELCQRARVSAPEIAGRIAVLLEREPDAASRDRLAAAGARVVVGPHDPPAVQELVRSLAPAPCQAVAG